MAIDEAALVSPFQERRTSDPQAHPSELVSPFDLKETATKMREADHRIGSEEEIEGMLALGSSFLSAPVAGFAGLVQQVAEEHNLLDSELLGYEHEFDQTPEELIESVGHALTYEPRTEGGKEYAETLATPFMYIDKAAQYVGDRVFDATDSPAAGATAKTVTMMLVPTAVRKIGAGTMWTGKQAGSIVVSAAETINMLRAKPRSNYSRDAVGESLRTNIGTSSEVMANIERSKLLTEEIPGFKPTLGETTLKQSLISRERGLAEADQATMDIAVTRRKQNIAAVENFRKEHFGEASQEITSIFRNSEGNINNALTALEKRMNELDVQRNKLAEKSPAMDLDVVGSQLRKIEKEQYLAAKAHGEILYNKIGDARVNPEPIVKKVNKLFESDLLDFADQHIPASLKKVKRELTKEIDPKTGEPAAGTGGKLAEDGTISFETMRSLETSLKQDLASERGKADGSKLTERLLSQTLDSVKEVKNVMRETQDAPVVQALEEATTFWREGVADRFYRGAGRDIKAKTAQNEYRIVDEKVIDSFFTTATKGKGGVKGIDDFINTYGMHPEAWAQLRIGVHQKFRDFTGVTKDGVINTSKAEIFMNRHNAVLNRIPDIRNELASSTKASKALDGTAKMLKQRQVNIEHSILAKTFKSHTPETIVKNSIKDNPKEMHKLRSASNKVKGGNEALSRATGRELLSMAERADGTINSAKLLNLMDKNSASIKVGMGFEHFNQLKTLHEAYLRLDKNVLPSFVKEPKLGLERAAEYFGTTPAQAISAWRAKSRGLVGGPHLVAQVGTSFITKINKRQIDAIERVAHYDIEVAKTLVELSKAKGAPSTALQTKMSKHLSDYGIMALSTDKKDMDENN